MCIIICKSECKVLNLVITGKKWGLLLLAIFLVLLLSVATTDFSHVFVQATESEECSVSVYVVSLDGVANHVATNNSRIVDGVLDASDVDEVIVSLDIGMGIYSTVHMNVTVNVVNSWDFYKELVNSYSGVVIVNSHDECLPVPSGYTKEEWVGRIADFMMNRWGTWVHAGGYPFYYVQYEDRRVETWGKEGFQALMSYMGKGNANCEPLGNKENEHATIDIAAFQQISISWSDIGTNYRSVNVGKPLKFSDFKEDFVIWLYRSTWEGETHLSGAIVKFISESGTYNYGIYVHLGSWLFYDKTDKALNCDFAMGYVSTASAIWSQVAWSNQLLFEAERAINKAQSEGRTSGLNEAKTKVQQATIAYTNGNYNKASSYAEQAKNLAENATQPFLTKFWPYITLLITLGIIVTYEGYREINKKKSFEFKAAPKQEQSLSLPNDFLVISR